MTLAPVAMTPAQIYQRLLRYVYPYWKGFTLAVIGMMIFALTNAGFSALMKPLLDGSFVEKDPDIIRWMPIAIIVIFLIRAAGYYTSTNYMSAVGRHVIKDMRRLMFHHLLHLPTSFYDNSTSGQLVSKLIYDVEQVAQAVTNAVTVIIRDTLTVIGLVAWMLYLNWRLALVFALIAPPIAALIAYVNRRFRQISGKIQMSMGDVTHAAEEGISGHRVIKTFGGQDYEEKYFEQANEANRRLNMKIVRISSASVPIIQLIAAIALAGIIFFSTMETVVAQVTVGTFVSFITAMLMLQQPLNHLTSVNAIIQRGIAAAQSIFSLLDSPLEEDQGTMPLARARGTLEYRNVSFMYDPYKGMVLNDISFKAEPGQVIAFVGRSGSGKSTLVSLLPRFYEVTSGHILVDDINIRNINLKDLRQQIAWVGQDVMLFNDTIANNIAYGAMSDKSSDDIMRAAEAAHAMEFIRQLPEGLNTIVGEKGVLLSGGQRQRLAIARALIKDAPILILDEATSALDTESERYIQGALQQLMRNRTTLVIAHRLSTIENADLIVVMDRGRIVESGRHDELLQRAGHYATLHRMQFKSTQGGSESKDELSGRGYPSDLFNDRPADA